MRIQPSSTTWSGCEAADHVGQTSVVVGARLVGPLADVHVGDAAVVGPLQRPGVGAIADDGDDASADLAAARRRR